MLVSLKSRSTAAFQAICLLVVTLAFTGVAFGQAQSNAADLQPRLSARGKRIRRFGVQAPDVRDGRRCRLGAQARVRQRRCARRPFQTHDSSSSLRS